MNTSVVNQIGKTPVVVLPLSEYEKMREDLEMFKSRSLAKDIKKARADVASGKTYNLSQIKKLLNLL